jgi:hypothetical protein
MSVTRRDLEVAISEAKRFLLAAEVALKQKGEYRSGYVPYGSKAAACKRASMDLTKALAHIRKSNQ